MDTNNTKGDLPKEPAETVETTPVEETPLSFTDEIEKMLESEAEQEEPSTSEEEPEEKTDEPDESEPEVVNEPELDDPDGDDSDDKDGLGELDDRFTLDTSIEDALKDNEKAQSRLKQQIKGWKKLAERFDKPEVQELVNNRPYIMNLHQMNLMMRQEPDRFVTELDNWMKQNTGYSIADYLPDTDIDTETVRPRKPEVNIDEVVRQRVDEAMKPVREKEAKMEQERQWKEYLDKATPATVAYIEKTHNGWKVTREMVAEAVTNLPQFKTKPATAVMKFFGDQYLKYASEKAAETPKPKDMLVASQKKSDKDPTQLEDMSPESIMRWMAAIQKDIK